MLLYFLFVIWSFINIFRSLCCTSSSVRSDNTDGPSLPMHTDEPSLALSQSVVQVYPFVHYFWLVLTTADHKHTTSPAALEMYCPGYLSIIIWPLSKLLTSSCLPILAAPNKSPSKWAKFFT